MRAAERCGAWLPAPLCAPLPRDLLQHTSSTAEPVHQELLCKPVKRDELHGKFPGFLKALSHQHVLADGLQIGPNHRARPEVALDVLRQFRPPRVTRVHGDEVAHGRDLERDAYEGEVMK